MSWIQLRSQNESLRFISQVSSLCASLGGDVAKELDALVQQQRYREVVDYEINYQREGFSYSDIKYSRQILALFAKQDYIDVGYDTLKEATKTFLACEERCRETNNQISQRAPHGAAASIFFRASRKIADVLGDVPSLGSLDLSFGPGAQTNVKMANACFRYKLSAKLTCSDDTLPVVAQLLEELPVLALHHSSWTVNGLSSIDVDVTPGRVQFVPKSSKTKRSIIVEPTLTGMVQRGIGAFIKDRLLKTGIDLRDQTRNKSLAWRGSLDNSLATVDLSSASDCVALSLVFDLLPYPWAEFLSYYRSGYVVGLGEGSLELEKFSSMGNGYTFELESLIFYALAWAVLDYLNLDQSNLSIFGDDIIIPSDAYGLLEVILQLAGFSVNNAKSFHAGPFRESCGSDWYLGLDVRPFYLRERVSDEVLYTFHNWAMRNCERELADLCFEWTQPELRLFGPDGFGDGHLIGSHQLRLNRVQRRSGWCGGFFDTYTRRKKFFKKLLPGDWIVPSYSVYTRSGQFNPTDPDIVRGSSGYAKTSVYTLSTSIFGRR